ncbi:MAG: hypothetical protein JRN52_14500 [Nitrososphaerota archaeon]|nr:hypothetical protein [Nitrososphaerota archaeon]
MRHYTSEPVPNFLSLLGKSITGFKIALLKEFFFDTASKEVQHAIEDAVDVFKNLGMLERKIVIPHLKYIGLVRMAHASEGVLGREGYLLSRPRDYSPDILGLLIQALLQPSIYYAKGTRVRRLIAEEFENALHEEDTIVTPVIPIPAPKISDCRKNVVTIDGRKVRVRDLRSSYGSLFVRLTSPFNLTGHPTVSLPCGFSSNNLPIGLQVTSAYYDEAKLLQIAGAYERATNWHNKRMPID